MDEKFFDDQLARVAVCSPAAHSDDEKQKRRRTAAELKRKFIALPEEHWERVVSRVIDQHTKNRTKGAPDYAAFVAANEAVMAELSSAIQLPRRQGPPPLSPEERARHEQEQLQGIASMTPRAAAAALEFAEKCPGAVPGEQIELLREKARGSSRG